MVKEEVSVEEKALRYVAKAADGSMRDALSLLDQCIAFYLGENLTYDKVLQVLGAVDNEIFSHLLRAVIAHDVTEAIGVLEEMVIQGRDLNQFVIEFTWYMRNLMLVKSDTNMEDVLEVSSEHMALLKEEAAMVKDEVLMRYVRIFSELSNQIRQSSQKRVLIEIALIKLCRPQMEQDYEAIVDRLDVVEHSRKYQRKLVYQAGQLRKKRNCQRRCRRKLKNCVGNGNRLFPARPDYSDRRYLALIQQ